MNQDGTIIGSKFNRLSVRANLDAQLKKWLKIELSAAFTDSNDDLKLTDGAEGIVGFALTSLPEAPIYDINGNYNHLLVKTIASTTLSLRQWSRTTG